jgi:hypothetical protein
MNHHMPALTITGNSSLVIQRHKQRDHTIRPLLAWPDGHRESQRRTIRSKFLLLLKTCPLGRSTSQVPRPLLSSVTKPSFSVPYVCSCSSSPCAFACHLLLFSWTALSASRPLALSSLGRVASLSAKLFRFSAQRVFSSRDCTTKGRL